MRGLPTTETPQQSAARRRRKPSGLWGRERPLGAGRKLRTRLLRGRGAGCACSVCPLRLSRESAGAALQDGSWGCVVRGREPRPGGCEVRPQTSAKARGLRELSSSRRLAQGRCLVNSFSRVLTLRRRPLGLSPPAADAHLCGSRRGLWAPYLRFPCVATTVNVHPVMDENPNAPDFKHLETASCKSSHTGHGWGPGF